MPHFTLHLNAKLQPEDRHDLEDILNEFLQEKQLWEVTGGGTSIDPSGEPSSCDIEILAEKPEPLIELINEIGVPLWSKLTWENFEQAIWELQGLALYLNGTDLPDQVYQNCDINHVDDQIFDLLEDAILLNSFYEGELETALYYYIDCTFEEAKAKIMPFLKSYPLCQKCRIVKIA